MTRGRQRLHISHLALLPGSVSVKKSQTELEPGLELVTIVLGLFTLHITNRKFLKFISLFIYEDPKSMLCVVVLLTLFSVMMPLHKI